MCVCINVKYRYFCQNFNKTRIFSTHIRRKTQTPNFIQIRSNWSRVTPCGHTSGQTGVKKLAVAFHSFTNAPKEMVSTVLLMSRSYGYSHWLVPRSASLKTGCVLIIHLSARCRTSQLCRWYCTVDYAFSSSVFPRWQIFFNYMQGNMCYLKHIIGYRIAKY